MQGVGDSTVVTLHCRKIRLIEDNATCRHLKKGFAAGVYLFEAYLVYLFTGKGEESLTREKGRGATVHISESKIPT